jgi:excisionase family DNA binding protein
LHEWADDNWRQGHGDAAAAFVFAPDEAARVIGVSRRTLAAWQATRVIGFRRVGRRILFSVADIQAALDRYRIAPISYLPKRKRRMQRITLEPVTK